MQKSGGFPGLAHQTSPRGDYIRNVKLGKDLASEAAPDRPASHALRSPDGRFDGTRSRLLCPSRHRMPRNDNRSIQGRWKNGGRRQLAASLSPRRSQTTTKAGGRVRSVAPSLKLVVWTSLQRCRKLFEIMPFRGWPSRYFAAPLYVFGRMYLKDESCLCLTRSSSEPSP